MKALKMKSLIIAASLAFASFSANATVAKSVDQDPAPDSEFYDFSSLGPVGASFSDFLEVSFAGTRDLVAGVTGTSTGSISFTTFDLVASDMTTVLATGLFTNVGPRLAFGGLQSINGVGDYFIHIAGVSTGVGGYEGTLSLISPVPEPEAYLMFLAGLGVMGYMARRNRKV